ncbi:serine/threonine protein kinase [Spirillospora albida]|uniref:serine/threonine protein kinase n=1 Tax=Spirillospora albida TaxID=58123 RepID=UPI00068D080F|nr:serine/threonine-protein kinase [Spirillospora albida]
MPEALPLQSGDPRRLGSYELTARLGVGDQGAVFLGRAGVAVKLLHLRLSGEPVARERFTNAFAAARRVSGFGTAAILDADVDGDRAYVVSEFVDGPSLQRLVDEEGARGPAVVERLAVGVAVAMAAAHRAGAAHLDLKPGNVLLGQDGPRVSDLGIAGALEAVNAVPLGAIPRNPAYKAPEQLSGKGIGPAADVFAWASVMLFATYGRPAFQGGSASEVMQRIVYDEPDLSAVPDGLREVIAAALAKDPAERPTSEAVLGRLLDARSPLAARIPASLLEEGRALLGGAAVPPPRRAEPKAGARRSRRAEPAAADIDPASFEATTAFGALGADATSIDLVAVPAEPGEATALFTPSPEFDVPPSGFGERGSTAALKVPGIKRPGGHVLGVALSLSIGVGVGIAIIALVLWPQLRREDAPPADQTNAADNRPVTTIPASFAGRWTGRAVNNARNTSFPIEVTFEAGGTTARAVYPREKCDGLLTLTKGTGSRLDMALTVDKPCTSGNVQITRKSDGTLEYAWSRSGTSLRYAGRLSRG